MTDTVRVPREPTPEMLKAGASTLDDFWKAQERGPTHVQEAWPGIVQIYAAMLAASPQGEGSSGDSAPIKPSNDTGEQRDRVARIIDPSAFLFSRDELDAKVRHHPHDAAYALADAILDLIQSERGKAVPMTAQDLAEHAQFAFENDLPDDFTPYDCTMAWRRVGEHLAAVLAERAEG